MIILAKNKNTKKKTKKVEKVIDRSILPQNIVMMGERVEENKNIYIHQKTYNQIHRFTKNKTKNESGGMLVGYVIEEFGKTNIIIDGFIEAKYCEATPTTLKFTHETWENMHEEMEKKYKDEKIVGWIHTHPDFGIFLSEYDKFIHENFFREDYQIAYVVDPIREIEGFYFWINEKLEKCKGFYIYDETGKKIEITDDSENDNDKEKTSSGFFTIKNIALVFFVIISLLLVFLNVSQNKTIVKLEREKDALQNEAQQVISWLESELNSAYKEINELKNPQPEETTTEIVE